MSVFTNKEIEYLQSQRLGRLATIDPLGQPQNSPVGFRYNPQTDTIDVGGRALGKTKKFHNIQNNPKVAFVVDDVLPPWLTRCVEIRGTAQALPSGGRHLYGPNSEMDDAMIRITPLKIISWGLDPLESGDNYTRARENRTVRSGTD